MGKILGELTPKELFINFEELTKIPRESGNEKEVSDFLVEFAKKNGLEVIQEECLNVIIKKPATPGYENSKAIILQGHMDMVCVKDEDLDFDFEREAIPIFIDGDYIRTKGTTLGADNGIAVAMIMSILESKELSHPAITALITSDEEVGMKGVMALEPKNIDGEILINLDSEEEGVALCSCAGGVRNSLHIPVSFLDNKLEDFCSLNIKIRGLLGGHSGSEINRNRANSIKLLGRLLNKLNSKLDFKLSYLLGGDKMNAIAKSAQVGILVAKNDKDKAIEKIKLVEAVFKNEFSISDSNIKIEIEDDNFKEYMDDKSKNDVINALTLMPFGIQTMSSSIEGLVESSTNIGVLSTSKSEVLIESAIRSSVKTLKNEISDRIDAIARAIGGKSVLESDYPEWEFKEKSDIREIMKSTYLSMFENELKIDAIHAGLECGFLKEKLGDIDMISIGPNMWDVHTPYEKLSISSTKKVYEFLVKVLEKSK